MSQELTRRQRAVAEIFSSEEKYIKDLEALIACFYSPLKQAAIENIEPMLLTLQEHSTIFGPIEQLLNLNRRMFIELKKNGLQTFKVYSAYFKMYGLYASSYQNATTLLSNLKVTREALEPWLQGAATSPMCRGLRLSDFLIMPVQRVPRYRMLLAEVLKHSDETEDQQEFQDLTQALESIKHVGCRSGAVQGFFEDS